MLYLNWNLSLPRTTCIFSFPFWRVMKSAARVRSCAQSSIEITSCNKTITFWSRHNYFHFTVKNLRLKKYPAQGFKTRIWKDLIRTARSPPTLKPAEGRHWNSPSHCCCSLSNTFIFIFKYVLWISCNFAILHTSSLISFANLLVIPLHLLWRWSWPWMIWIFMLTTYFILWSQPFLMASQKSLTFTPENHT